MGSLSTIATQKEIIRNSVVSKINKIPLSEKNRQKDWITEKLLSHKKLSKKSWILAYTPLEDEMDLSQLFFSWFQKKFTLCFTKIVQNTLEVFQITKDPSASFWRKNKNIVEPHDSFSFKVNPQRIDSILIPGRAFDNKGTRLGRGLGYYDRFLKKVPKAYKIGIGFSCQVQENLPREKHDILMDEILICP